MRGFSRFYDKQEPAVSSLVLDVNVMHNLSTVFHDTADTVKKKDLRILKRPFLSIFTLFSSTRNSVNDILS